MEKSNLELLLDRSNEMNVAGERSPRQGLGSARVGREPGREHLLRERFVGRHAQAPAGGILTAVPGSEPRVGAPLRHHHMCPAFQHGRGRWGGGPGRLRGPCGVA